MKEERIVEILGMVDEKYVEEAAPVPRRKKLYEWGKWVVVAACVIAVSWFVCNKLYILHLRSITGPNETLMTEVTQTPAPIMEVTPTPTLEQAPSMPTQKPIMEGELSEDGLPFLMAEIDLGDMGYEAVAVYDISEFGSRNPWTQEVELETLPVYRNLAWVKGGSGVQVWYSAEELYAKAEEVALLLNTEIISVEYGMIPKDLEMFFEKEGPNDIKVQTSLGSIEINGNGKVRIGFEPALTLPVETTQYLLEQFAVLWTGEYIVDTWEKYYDSGEVIKEYEAFKEGDYLEEQILNYNFARIRFWKNWENKLSSIDFGNQLDCTELLGRYPIISWEAAQDLLLNGAYVTSVPEIRLHERMVQEEHIAKVELVYHHSALDKVFMPYYRFYLELTEDSDMAEGLKSYGAFYVPAVSGEYLVNFPVWDGSIN